MFHFEYQDAAVLKFLCTYTACSIRWVMDIKASLCGICLRFLNYYAQMLLGAVFNATAEGHQTSRLTRLRQIEACLEAKHGTQHALHNDQI